MYETMKETLKICTLALATLEEGVFDCLWSLSLWKVCLSFLCFWGVVDSTLMM